MQHSKLEYFLAPIVFDREIKDAFLYPIVVSIPIYQPQITNVSSISTNKELDNQTQNELNNFQSNNQNINQSNNQNINQSNNQKEVPILKINDTSQQNLQINYTQINTENTQNITQINTENISQNITHNSINTSLNPQSHPQSHPQSKENESSYQLTNTEITSQLEQFLVAYIKDNNFSPNLYSSLLYSLTQQIKYTKQILFSWFTFLQKLPESYQRKQILVDLQLEVQIEHLILTDTLCWDLRKIHFEVERIAEEIVRDELLEPQWAMLISYAIRKQILNKMHRFSSGDVGLLIRHIDSQEINLLQKIGDEYSVIRRNSDLLKYKPQIRQLTAIEIRNSKHYGDFM